jgi:hypothetical protein
MGGLEGPPKPPRSETARRSRAAPRDRVAAGGGVVRTRYAGATTFNTRTKFPPITLTTSSGL